jgi:chromosome segregation ATPase
MNMTLKALELAGFKSFGRKSTVSFTTPITAVVGPNGSGKSNIVESIRFVLGEQSMKSLRGKGGIDLIFKGSKGMSSANRALVTITFDNSKKIFSFTNSGLGVSLDYDEITISREVFSDGANKYSINGTEVRLKDVVDLLASVNIGSSGHHIISQGEADRVLNASNKDRRAMIEDALGLKVYQYRIRESERKLEKTAINMKEVQALRREIAPHLAFLKKQVAVVEKARLMREELRDLYKAYFSSESSYIHKENKRLTHVRNTLAARAVSLDERISELQGQKSDERENPFKSEINKYNTELSDLRTKKGDLSRALGRIEGILESLERQLARKPEEIGHVISESEWKNLIAELEAKIDQALATEDLPQVAKILREMKERLSTLFSQKENKSEAIDEHLDNEKKNTQKEKDGIVAELEAINAKERDILVQLSLLAEKQKQAELTLRDSERVLYELMNEKNEVTSELHSLTFEEEKLALIKNAYEIEIMEGGALIGSEVMTFRDIEVRDEVSRQAQDELRKKIERIKIKLEDAGSGNGGDIMKEYEETEERDRFLAREIDDLTRGIDSLRILIQELKETLDSEFKDGVGKINKQFQEFFALMFGGGSAFLSIVMEHKRTRKSKDEDMEDEEEAEGENDETEIGFERGIEINVTLPHKKVKDLHMLSGGERSLASIALLFAISQVNPPPFLVLDETDAALDEANSRKYGNMLENLSKYSQLIVVTHNRETMSRANVLYGVTMSSEGASKLLSIHLEDASAYAK